MISPKNEELLDLILARSYSLITEISSNRSKSFAYDEINKRYNDAQQYYQKYLMPNAWGKNIWHAILDDAIRMREQK